MAKSTVDRTRGDGADVRTGQPLRLVGRRWRRSDAPERLTGQVLYTDDLGLRGALHAAFVPSPFTAARVVSIDKAEALAIPGVVAVYTARDLPLADVEDLVAERRIPIALDHVVHAGQPVAVVLAETGAAAEDGAAAVRVEYEERPAAVDPLAAMAQDAPVVREHRERDTSELAMHGATVQGSDMTQSQEAQAPNVTDRMSFRRGDVERGFAEADVVLEHELRTSWVHQGYIEPQTCAAAVDPLGGVVVYTSTQALFHARHEVATALGIPDQDVRVHAMPVGGGFGGKFGFLEALVAALAKAAGSPVRLTYRRTDEFLNANPTSQSVMRLKVGAKRDGTLTTLQARLVFDAGSNPGAPVGSAAFQMASNYRWQHLLVEGFEVLTNRPGVGAYRAPGAPQGAFAVESMVDEVARKLGIDPLELRRRNAVREGDKQGEGRPWPRMGLHECLDALEPHYRRELADRKPGEGIGIAVGGWQGGVEPSAATCRLNADGSLQVALGSVDLTGTNTTFQIIAAEAFGLSDPGQVRVVTADSDSAPYAGASGGSKITYTVGPAVRKAAEDARNQVLKIAAADLEASVEDLELVDGQVRVRGVPGRARTLAEICRLSGSFGAKYEPVFGRGQAAITDRSPGFAAHLARVRVDPDTGRVIPLRYVAVQDVGRAINPATVEGQMLGGAAQGAGWALYEQLAFDESGAPTTGSFIDYVLPRATQVPPEIEPVIVEVPSAVGPYGAKGVGEPPVIPSPAAFANAVRDATGVRLTHLPMTPERVFAALAAASGTG